MPIGIDAINPDSIRPPRCAADVLPDPLEPLAARGPTDAALRPLWACPNSPQRRSTGAQSLRGFLDHAGPKAPGGSANLICIPRQVGNDMGKKKLVKCRSRRRPPGEIAV
jgi:hypothetical protein